MPAVSLNAEMCHNEQMPKKKTHDTNQTTASLAVQVTTDERGELTLNQAQPSKIDGLSAAAMTPSGSTGAKDAKTGPYKLSPRARRQMARKAAELRWGTT